MLNLLAVDDDKVTRSVIEKCTKKWGYRVYSADNGCKGREILKKKNINIAILDWELPDMSGTDLAMEIRSKISQDYIYVIILTSRNDSKSVLKGFEAGADDYIFKPFNVYELRARITTGARIIKLQKKLQRSQKRLKEIATHDGLTGILNRRAVLEVVNTEFVRSSRIGTDLGFISLDVDHFKSINDTYGHPAGDKVLKMITKILGNSLRTYDKLGRMGGEEFLAVLPDCNRNQIEKIAERLRKNIENHGIIIGDLSIPVTVSMGLTVYNRSKNLSIKSVLQVIDEALYEAKESGRNKWVHKDLSNPGKKIGGNYEKREKSLSKQFN